MEESKFNEKTHNGTTFSMKVVPSSQMVQDDYEPYKHRLVKRPMTNLETLAHLTKLSLGSGILAVPQAFSHSGYLVGIIGTFLVGILCTYCIHMLIRTQYDLCKRRKVSSLGYHEIAVASMEEGPDWCVKLAPISGLIANVYMLLFAMGASCVYIVFIAENLKKIGDLYIEGEVKLYIYMLCILGPMILINLVNNLKLLAPLSKISVLANFTGFSIIFYYLFKDSFSFEGKSASGNVENYPLFFGTVLFALEAIGLMLPLEHDMKNPQDFLGKFGVLNQSAAILVVLYCTIGFSGYLRFGNEVQGSITLNLPGNTEMAAQVVQILLACAMFASNALCGYVSVGIIWDQCMQTYFTKKISSTIVQYIVRAVVVLITFGFAVGVPYLGLFISLIGAFCISQLGLIFPAIFETVAYWKHTTCRQRILMLMKNFIIFLCGIFGLIIGTYTSIKEIVNQLNKTT